MSERQQRGERHGQATAAGGRAIEVHGGVLRVAGAAGARKLTVGPTPRVVGRSEGCDLVLLDDKVSAVHLELVATDDGVRVRDLGSRNGTFLHGHRIFDVCLCEDAQLECGDTRLLFSPTKPEAVPISRSRSFGPLVARTPRMLALFEQLRVLAKAKLSILILGDTGTGKELVAQAIHQASPRSSGPFVVVDCGAIPASLAESVLFGHERGAFTGAIARRESPFVEAAKGTIFLDELGELPLETQPKLLRALAEKRVKRVGATAYESFDARVVAATRRDILHEVNAGAFRSDLYFRIAQARVELPALRERTEDVPVLIEHAMTSLGAAEAYGRITVESIEKAQRHDWPGNVRELRSVVELALAFDTGGPIDLTPHLASSHGLASRRDAPDTSRTFAEAKRELERSYFLALNEECHGNVSEIARRAGVDRKTARECLHRHRHGR
jgi:DNA-binding NtrC family response regulator